MEKIPGHHHEEMRNGTILLTSAGLISLLLLIHLVQIAPSLSVLLNGGVSSQSWQVASTYLGGYYDKVAFIANVKTAYGFDAAMTIVSILMAVVISALPMIIALAKNPFRMYPLIHGDARMGNDKDIRMMEDRKQVGIKGAQYLHLGNWPNTKEPMRLIETLSTLVLAPPGTGKTATFVVPSIIDTDSSSFIINDPKPELFEMTSGHRANVGHVFMIDWSATDKVDPLALDDPNKTVFYARFNPLSPLLLPPRGTADRDTYLDAISSVMSPSAKSGGGSDYFEQKGRAALVGFLHYICSKIADAPTGSPPNLENIPSHWHGPDMEPSIPMLIDLITEGQHNANTKNDQAKKDAQTNGQFYQGDALADWLKSIVQECIDNEYSPRSITEITPLVNMAPNERSGILGTMDKAFLPFKNAAVRERTSSCDFVPADLRGMGPKGERNGKQLPVSLYVCVNQATASAFATITSLLYEVLSREYLAYGPGEKNLNGRKLGPYPICFMLDEFAKLPRIEAVMTGPDLGRSKKTMYCLVAQSDAQIGKLYSKEDQQIIYATTAVKYILPQNDKDTIKLVQDMIGPTTIKRTSRSKNIGADLKEWGKSNQSHSIEKVDFIRPGDVSGMKPGTHILVCQGFMNRPYFMQSVFFFKDPDMLAKVYNPRTEQGPAPAYPVPEFIRKKRIEEWKKRNPDKIGDIQHDRIEVGRAELENAREPMTT